MSPDEATRCLADALARRDHDAVDVAVEALREPVRVALSSGGLPSWWLDDELPAVLAKARSLDRGWIALRGELRAFVRRSHREMLAGAVAPDARRARLRGPSRRFIEARQRTRDGLAQAWADSLLDASRMVTVRPPLREVARAAARAFESSRSRDCALRATVEAIVRCQPEERVRLCETRTPQELPTALAAEYVSARELRSEGALQDDGTVEPRAIQTVVVDATLDALLSHSDATFSSYCETTPFGASLVRAQREATDAFVELLPFLDLDLRRVILHVAPFLARTKISDRELLDFALDRLRVRGVRPEGEVREPYHLLLAWLRSTAKRRALDAYRARSSEVDAGVLDDLEAPSNLRELDVDEGERGAGWWLARLEAELTPSLRETLHVWRSRESISSAEIAVELGLLPSSCIADAAAGDDDALAALKRACNNVDTRRKRIREQARRLVEADERRSG